MAKYFNLEEFLTSSTARQKSIENLPSWDVIDHLKELASFLDQLREDWGSGIKVTSGFRNDKLNSAVGGVGSSVHMIGYAADIVPANGKFKEFTQFIEKWAKTKSFDQIIIEKSKKSQWVHIGLFNNKHQQRKMVFLMDVK
jgi:hypothetical protein